MNKTIKSTVCLLLAAVILLGSSACGKKKTSLDLSLFPLVYSDENGLQAIKEGEKKPTLITKNFYTFLNAENKVQAASDGKIYFIETEDAKKTIGDLYSYSVTEKNEKKRKQLIHSGVYSYKVSHDASCIIINDGTGNMFKYDKKLEKKGEYPFIQSSGVSGVVDISADGKYVLYTQVLKGTNYQTLTIARTDFQTTEEIDKMSLKNRRANKDVNKAPVIIAENYRTYVGSSDDLSAIYYTTEKYNNKKEIDKTLYLFKNFKENLKLCAGDYEAYFVKPSGEMMYSVSAQNVKKISDIVTDKYFAADKKLNHKKATKKQLQAKKNRVNLRKRINQYLINITTTDFYKVSKSSKAPELIKEVSGQMRMKGVDDNKYVVFAYATNYDFSKAKKPDINKVKTAYKLFDKIKSKSLFGVSFKKSFNLNPGKGVSYSNSDCFVDAENGKMNYIADFNFLAKKEADKVGTLYSVTYTDEKFETPKKIVKGAAKVAHFNSEKDYYYVLSNNTLVKNNAKTVVLKDYGRSSLNPDLPLVYTSIGTGKKNKYGFEITENKAYYITGGKALELGDIFENREIVTKNKMFAYYTSFDYKTSTGAVTLYNGKELVDLGKKVGYIYSFGG